MREIKFRAWDKENREMVIEDTSVVSPTFSMFITQYNQDCKNFELMQYTGENSLDTIATVHPVYNTLSNPRKIKFLELMKSWCEEELKNIGDAEELKRDSVRADMED